MVPLNRLSVSPTFRTVCCLRNLPEARGKIRRSEEFAEREREREREREAGRTLCFSAKEGVREHVGRKAEREIEVNSDSACTSRSRRKAARSASVLPLIKSCADDDDEAEKERERGEVAAEQQLG